MLITSDLIETVLAELRTMGLTYADYRQSPHIAELVNSRVLGPNHQTTLLGPYATDTTCNRKAIQGLVGGSTWF